MGGKPREVKCLLLFILILSFSATSSWFLRSSLNYPTLRDYLGGPLPLGPLIIITFLLSFLVFYSLVKGRLSLLGPLIRVTSLIATYFSAQLYCYIALSYLGYGLPSYAKPCLVMLIPLLIVPLTLKALGGKGTSRLLASLVTFYSVTLGSLIGLALSFSELVTLVALASAIDIYSVFKGPISRLVSLFSYSKGAEALLEGALIPMGEVRVGAGDLIFYSMIIAHTYDAKPYSPLITLTAVSSILVGVYLTVRGLRRRRVLPALPLPASLSLSSIFLISALTHSIP